MTVVSLDSMRPKTLNRRYLNHDYKVIYNKETDKWIYEITYVQIVKFTGEEDTPNKSIRAAEKHIDQSIKTKKRA